MSRKSDRITARGNFRSRPVADIRHRLNFLSVSTQKRIILLQNQGISGSSVCLAYSSDALSQVGLTDHPTGRAPKAAQAGEFIHWALNGSRSILGRGMSSKRVSHKALQIESIRQWIGLIVVYLSIPLALLLCGGDFGWWQAWIYSLLISAAGIGGRIWAEQRHPGLMAERQNIESVQGAKAWDKVLAPLMALSVAHPLVIVAGLDHRYGWSPEFPLWLIVLGLILISLGYGFAAWALAENRFFSSVVRIQTDRGHVVCDSGPYRIVRHPGYAGNILALPGIVLALGSVWALIPAAVALIIAVIRTALEDQTLQEELPGYRDYAQRVCYRLMPGVF